MICRFLILVIILFSTSCIEETRDVEAVCDAVCQKPILTNDTTDNAQNLCFSWFGLVVSNDAHFLRNDARMRTVQRTIEKRKILSANSLTVISKTNLLKHLAQKRLLLCHLRHYGGSLLHLLCKLSL